MFENLLGIAKEMKKDLVSVIITTYNRPDDLKKALKSVQVQTYLPIEIIIVDDAGKRFASKIVKDNEIKIIRHKINLGLAAARNTGFRCANGKYIAFLDDDDEFTPDKIEKQVKLLSSKNSTYALVYCGQKVYRPNGSFFVMKPRLKGNIKNSIVENEISSISSSYLFRKSVLEEIGGFDESLKNNIDHDLWMTFASKGWYCDHIMEPLTVNYRKFNRRLTTNITARLKEVEKYIKKWTPVFQDWYGDDCKNYVNNYRYRVYSMLANDRLMKGDLSGAMNVYGRILKKSTSTALTNAPSFIVRAFVLYSLSILYKFVSPHSKIRYY